MPGRNNTSYKAIKPVEPRTVNRILWWDEAGSLRKEPIGPAILNEPFHVAQPARVPKPYKGMPNRHGRYWMAATGSQVWHESMLERWALMLLDFVGDVVAVRAQPFLMQFEDGTRHYPDYFVIDSRGRPTILDVHFSGFNSERNLRKFQNTQEACRRIGWSYTMFSSVDPVVLRNVEFLALYRRPRYTPDEPTRSAITAAARDTSMTDLLASAGPAQCELTRCHIYSLMWSGDLLADLTRPLTDHTLVRTR